MFVCSGVRGAGRVYLLGTIYLVVQQGKVGLRVVSYRTGCRTCSGINLNLRGAARSRFLACSAVLFGVPIEFTWLGTMFFVSGSRLSCGVVSSNVRGCRASSLALRQILCVFLRGVFYSHAWCSSGRRSFDFSANCSRMCIRPDDSERMKQKLIIELLTP
jgi:hypothetical protein